MNDVVFSDRALSDMDTFLGRLRVKFHEIYSDTGLHNEEQIHNDYSESLNLLQDEIYREITKSVTGSNFWVIVHEDRSGVETIIRVRVRSYIVSAVCRRYKKENVCTIDWIAFGKRK